MEPWETQFIATVAEVARTRIAPRSADVDLAGVLSQENIADLKEVGATSAFLPMTFGGRGQSIEGTARMMEAIAYHDGSTALALTMHMLVSDALLATPPWEHRDKVLNEVGRAGALLSMPGSVPLAEYDTRTSGFAFTQDGETIIGNGKSGFATMSDAADYLMVGGHLARGDGEEPDIVFCLPATSSPGVKVMGNWNAMGMRATASHDVRLTNVAVPAVDALVVTMEEFRARGRGAAEAGTATAQDRCRGVIGVMGVWLGLSRAALDNTVEYSKQRYGKLALPTAIAGDGEGMRSDEAWAQIELGHMSHWIESSEILFRDFTGRLGSFETNQDFTKHLSLISFHMRRMTEEVAMKCMRVCGAHGFLRNRPLERIFRDLMGCNVMAIRTEQLAQSLGKSALGMEISFSGPVGSGR